METRRQINRLFLIWSVIIGVIALLQGVYFNFEVYILGVFQIIIIGVMYWKGELKWRLDGIRRLFYLFIFFYIVASLSAVDLGSHILGLLRYGVLLESLLLMDSFSSLLPNSYERLASNMVYVAALSGVCIFISFLPFDFLEPLRDFFVQENRLGGYFQYANTFAAYILGLLGLLLSRKTSGIYLEKFRNLIIIELTVMILMTQSRSVLLLLGLFWVCLVCYMGICHRIFRREYIWIPLIILMFVLKNKIFQNDFSVNRLSQITWSASEWQSRLLYYEDALRMIVNSPSGYGYMGYFRVQRMYQTGAAYLVRYVHSVFFQAGLDVGVGGLFVVIVSVWTQLVYFLQSLLNRRRQLVVVNLVGLVLTIHALIDFDFQFMAFAWLWIFIVLNSENGLYPQDKVYGKPKEKRKKKVWTKIGVLLIGVIYFYTSCGCLFEYAGHTQTALSMLPFDTKAQIAYLKSKNDTEEANKLKISLANKLIKTGAASYEGFAFLRDYYYNIDELEASLLNAKEAYIRAPLWLDDYEDYLRIAYEILYQRYLNGELYKVDPLFDVLFDAEKYIKNLESIKKNNYTIKHKVVFQLSNSTVDLLEQTESLYIWAK